MSPWLRRLLVGSCFVVALGLTSGARAQTFDCLEAGIIGSASPWPDYTGSGAVLAPHCYGTNHQTITGVERVVFLGDSITVGTPPTTSGDFFRTTLADLLVPQFGLSSPSTAWRNVNPVTGKGFEQESGGFANCGDWGARADDLLLGETQLADCFPVSVRSKRTLVVMTIGGNDIVNLASDGEGGAPLAQLIADRDAFIAKIDAGVAWFQAPGRFPNGVFVVFANIYDPTDGTNDLPGNCSGVGVDSLASIEDLYLESNEMLLDIAVDRGFDLVFMRERFCGHGLSRDDPASPCYRGAGADNYIDLTCLHPTPDGHDAIAIDFFATIAAPEPIPMLETWPLAALGIALAGLAVRI